MVGQPEMTFISAAEKVNNFVYAVLDNSDQSARQLEITSGQGKGLQDLHPLITHFPKPR